MESLLSKVLTYYDVETPASYRNLMRMNLASYIHLHFDALFEWPSLGHAFVSDRGRCYGLKSMCGVLVDGSVVPCCLDSKGDVTLGNIFNETMEQIKIATIGDSNKLKVGNGIIAIGNALGYGQSVTTGVVSALEREVTIDNVKNKMIQIDAAINGGKLYKPHIVKNILEPSLQMITPISFISTDCWQAMLSKSGLIISSVSLL